MSKSKQRRTERKKARASQKRQQRWVQYGSLALIILLIGLFTFFTLSGPQAPEQPIERLELDPVLGNPDAPISIVEYSAYGCEACRAWHQAGIIEQILQEFPNQVKFIYRDMPIIMPAWSQDMAEIAQCALDQGNDAFWLMHNALFSQTIQGSTSQADAIKLGANLGLDVNALQACVDANTHYNTVRYDMNRPEARGIRGTPTWFVDGQIIYNASPDILRQTIRTELEKLNS